MRNFKRGLNLFPAGILEQLLGIGFVAERDFLEAEESFKHRALLLAL
jgi:hypothetical protein